MKEGTIITTLIAGCLAIVICVKAEIDMVRNARIASDVTQQAITAGAARWTVNPKTGERRLEFCTCFKGEENADE